MKRIIIFLKISIMFLFFSLSANAQSGIEGKLVDESSGETIMFATVAIIQNGVVLTGTETDWDGFYSIENLSPGTYDIQYQFVGFLTKTIKNFSIEKDVIHSLDIEMKEYGCLSGCGWIPEPYPPLIDLENTTSGQIITFDRFKR